MKAVNTSKGGRRKTSQAFRDLVIIFLAAILVYEVSFIYDLFEPLYEETRAYDAWQVDELYIVFAFLTAAFAIFALRRWRELEREIARREELENHLVYSQKMDALGTLAGGLAHNFNNILAGIMGHSASIKLNAGQDSPVLDGMKRIDKLVLDGAGLTRALLTFSKSGKYKPVILNVNRVVSDALGVVEQTAGKGIGIRAELKPELPTIFGDEGQIHQAVINLLLNACQAMPEGGSLTIGTSDTGPDKGFFEVHPNLKRGPFVIITVSDTGSGINDEIRRHIFEPFFTTKDPESATGLGLAVVNGIVERHGGCIEVDTAPGAGSTFTVYLPAAEAEITEAPARDATTPKGGETVLIADDDEDFRHGITRQLVEAGYDVIEAAGGKETLEVLRDRRDGVKLLLLDARMKGISGIDTLKEIKEMVPDLPVIICTGGLLDDALQRMMDEKASDFIQKPFDFKNLEMKIRDLLGSR